MAAAIGLRDQFDASALRAIAKHSKDEPQASRPMALAAIYNGTTRIEAAKLGGVGLQINRDWVLRFNAHGPDGLIDRKAPGQPSRLKDEHRDALARMIEDGSTSVRSTRLSAAGPSADHGRPRRTIREPQRQRASGERPPPGTM